MTVYPSLEEKLRNDVIKVDMGCGYVNKQQPAEEWIYLDGNPDIFDLDICCDFSSIPLQDESVDVIFAGDVIEHIFPPDLDKILKEWYRILKPRGILTGRMPNLHSTMIRYANGELKLEDALGALYGSQENLWQQHYKTYTIFTLEELLGKYGFRFTDFSESPGNVNPHLAWWIVFTTTKQ